MYNVPWIIDNMILDPTEYKQQQRRPSEVELKVQKSLQQLTVPDWYLNKCRASPKIIVDRRPIESRPAPWKDVARIRGPLNTNPRKNTTANTAVVKPVVDERKISSPRLEKICESMRGSSVKSQTNISKTFPKISPSRKIQNINIVFPTTTAPSSPEKPMKSGVNDSVQDVDCLDQSIASIDFLNEFTPKKMSTLENQRTSVTASTPVKTLADRTLTFRKSPKTPRMNCPPPPVPTTPPNSSKGNNSHFRNEETFVVKKFNETSEFSDPGFLTPQKTSRNPRTNLSGSKRNQSDFLELSSNEDKLFSTPKKSTEMENIIKNQQKLLQGRSFVEEIIQALNSKCNSKVKSNYVSPASKNFVKKLVHALETGDPPKYRDVDEVCSSSDNEFKSESSSASISVKDSDSGSGSDSEPKLSTSPSRYSPFRSFSKALESRETLTPYVDDVDESVYWIPLPTCKLPRTSSLKNMMSRLSSHGSGSSLFSSASRPETSGDSRSSSSVSTKTQNSATAGWGKTFDKRQVRSRQLFRIDETTVIDSGYSDRSQTNSSNSSVVDESWYGDSETTQTASEGGEESENGYPGYTRTYRVRGYRQRTSVV